MKQDQEATQRNIQRTIKKFLELSNNQRRLFKSAGDKRGPTKTIRLTADFA